MPAYTKHTVVFKHDFKRLFCHCERRVDAGEHRCLTCGKELPEREKLLKPSVPRRRRSKDRLTSVPYGLPPA